MPSPQGRDPEIWQRIDALLSEALTLPASERESWLARLSRSDEELASTLREMLSRSETTDSFLRTPVSPDVLAVAGEAASLEEAGTTIGPYRLLRVLGAGGMGQVWLADRIDGTLHREVALKLPRTGWAPGLAQRLNQERDALAALEHPHIARLYDAGTTAEGRPYLAMEYVDGVPIDRYATAHHLSLRERLELFLQVAGAVSYAHAHLVVHRDLKPSNILVSETRGASLLDFGAAKLLREDGPGDSDLTRELGPALSPDYASPEQIRGERVTVATDVYSLGVVLFELLTGQRPYRLPRQSWAALIEAMRTLEVPLASTCAAADPRLARALRGDLDAVLSRALRKDPAERYPSVQALADDVARFLAGEPVHAKAQGAVERAWKFVHRNSVAVTTATVVLLVVGAAAGVALWQARMARAQAARAERVRGFIASILTSATPRTGVGGVVTATNLLGAAAGRIESELSGEPGVAAELGVIVAESLESLGETAKEEPVLRAAIPRAERIFGRSHPLTLHAKAMLSGVLGVQDVPRSLAILEEVIPDARKGLPATAEILVDALKDQSFSLAKLNRPEPSYVPLREAVQLAEKYFGALDERTIGTLELLANTYGRFGDRPNELTTASEAVERARRAFGARRPHNMLIACERTYADALRDNDRPGDAVETLRRVVADQQQLDAAQTARVRNAMVKLGIALRATGQLDEALSLIREGVALERRQNPADSDDRLAFATSLAFALAMSELTDEWSSQEEVVRELTFRFGEVHRLQVVQRVRRAKLAALLGRSAEVKSLVSEAQSMARPAEEPARVEAELVAALDEQLQLRFPEALKLLQRTTSEHRIDALPLKVQSDLAAQLGTVRLELGDLASAEKDLLRCRELFQRAQVQPSIVVRACLEGGARLDLRAHRFVEAEQVLLPLLAAWERVNPEAPGHGEALHWLAEAERGERKLAAAKRDAERADVMLRRSPLPALRRLVQGPRKSGSE